MKSKWYRVRVHATQDEEVFDNKILAVAWADKVAHTFNDRTMKFDIIKVTEETETYKCKE